MEIFRKAVKFIEGPRPTSKEVDIALLILRVIIAIFFIKFGYGKLFGAPGIEGFTMMMGAFGLPASALVAYLVGIAELFGGIAILLGVATRFSAFWLTVITFAAWVQVAGFGLEMGMELPNGKPFDGGVVDWVTLGITLALFVAGPGAYSVSKYMQKGDEIE